MKNKIIIILFILLSSCTKDLSIVNTNINYNPHIESIAMDSLFVLSEMDTSFLEINLFVSDQNGPDDIEQVMYYVKREGFYFGTANTTTSECEYVIGNDDGYITTDNPFLSYTDCYGNYDESLGKVCEELSYDECESSSQCSINDSGELLFYTFQLFNPFAYPYCGGFGTVKFQFQVTDSNGLQDVSEEITVEITP